MAKYMQKHAAALCFLLTKMVNMVNMLMKI